MSSVSPKLARQKPNSPKRFFHFRLWMIFPLFIPVAIWALYNEEKFNFSPEFDAIETRSKFDFEGMEIIDFQTLPDGSEVTKDQNVGLAFRSKGVTLEAFYEHSPDCLPFPRQLVQNESCHKTSRLIP